MDPRSRPPAPRPAQFPASDTTPHFRADPAQLPGHAVAAGRADCCDAGEAPQRPSRARPRTSQGRARVAGIAAGVALAGLGSSIAMAGALATRHARSSPALRPAATQISPRHDRTVSYPLTQVWPTALRYLRVDRGYTLVDRDAEAGFVLFDVPLGRPGDTESKVARGSIEMFATEDLSGRAASKIRVSTDAGPSHLPHAIAEGLAKKLRDERGAPAPPPPTPKQPPKTTPPDDGAPPLVDPPIQP